MNELPSAIWLAAHDAPGPTFRNDIADDYKATRKPMPDELRAQLEDIGEALDALGCVSIVQSGYEADDIIASVAVQAAPRKVMVLSSDKDLAQLVDDRVHMYDAKTHTTFDRDGVFKKYGVHPEQIADYLAMVGDSSDNIKGVTGIGAKGAAQLLETYKTLDNLLDNIDQLKGKRRENLAAAAASHLDQTRELIALRSDLDLGQSLQTKECSAPDATRMHQLAVRLNFPGIEAEFAPHEPVDVTQQPVIAELGEWQSAANKLTASPTIAVSPHLSASDPMQADLLGFAIHALADHSAGSLYISSQSANDVSFAELKPWLADANNLLIAHDAKLLLKVLARNGLRQGREIQCKIDCIMLASYALDSSVRAGHLSAMASHWVPEQSFPGLYEFHRNKFRAPSKGTLALSEEDQQAAPRGYTQEARAILAIHDALNKKLEEQPTAQSIYRDIEMPTMSALTDVEFEGIRLLREPLETLEEELKASIETLKQEAFGLAGHEFNLGSPMQIGKVLFDELKLESERKTAGKRRSTNHEALVRLATKHELPKVILQYRELDKIRSTYTHTLLEHINDDTGRVHSTFQQALVNTGRLSSQHPNLQNIPVRSDMGRRVRSAFHAAPGYTFLALDYSQVELRVMAVCSDDETMKQALAAGADLHAATAAELYGIPLEQVDKEQRSNAKAVVFGLIYGITQEGLSRNLGITRTDAKALMNAYFLQHPQVKKYMDTTKEQAHETGEVSTLYGRRIPIAAATSSDYRQRAHGERAAINAPIQGTAADIMKLALMRVHELLASDSSIDARIVLQIHDELILEVKTEQVQAVEEKVRSIMEAASDGRVPLVVDAQRGDDWGALA